MPHELPEPKPGDMTAEIFIDNGKARLRFTPPDNKGCFTTNAFESKDEAVDVIFALRMYSQRIVIVDNAKELYPTEQLKRRR